MADPVKGTDAIIQIFKAGSYRDYLCATDITIDIKTELKSVKTIGDGVWKRSRPQSIGYTITLNGLLKLNTGDSPMAFDLLYNQLQFVDIQFRITFTDEDNNIKAVIGNATVESSQFGGGSDGFATGQFTIVGNGELGYTNSLLPCDVTITGISATWDSTVGKYSINVSKTGTGTVYRYEYTINGRGRYIAPSMPFFIDQPLYSVPQTNYDMVIFPVCVNGFDGISNSTIIERHSGVILA